MVLRSNPTKPLRTTVLKDASYGVHADHKSQSAADIVIGDIITEEGATVSVMCTNKQKNTAMSPAQAELICISDK